MRQDWQHFLAVIKLLPVEPIASRSQFEVEQRLLRNARMVQPRNAKPEDLAAIGKLALRVARFQTSDIRQAKFEQQLQKARDNKKRQEMAAENKHDADLAELDRKAQGRLEKLLGDDRRAAIAKKVFPLYQYADGYYITEYMEDLLALPAELQSEDTETREAAEESRDVMALTLPDEYLERVNVVRNRIRMDLLLEHATILRDKGVQEDCRKYLREVLYWYSQERRQIEDAHHLAIDKAEHTFERTRPKTPWEKFYYSTWNPYPRSTLRKWHRPDDPEYQDIVYERVLQYGFSPKKTAPRAKRRAMRMLGETMAAGKIPTEQLHRLTTLATADYDFPFNIRLHRPAEFSQVLERLCYFRKDRHLAPERRKLSNCGKVWKYYITEGLTQDQTAVLAGMDQGEVSRCYGKILDAFAVAGLPKPKRQRDAGFDLQYPRMAI